MQKAISAEERLMGNNMLKAPLIKSAVLLSVILLLVYLTATSPDGSVWSSLGQIFLAVFRAAQLGVGLILALTLCFVVLMVIFLGGLTLISKESGARLFGQICGVISQQWHFLVNLVRRNACSSGEGAMAPSGGRLQDEIAAEVDGALMPLRSAQQDVQAATRQLQDRLAMLENDTRVQTLTDRLDAGEQKVGELEDMVARIGQHISSVQDGFALLKKQAEADRDALKTPELSGRIDKLEEAVSDLAGQVSSLKGAVDESGAGTGTAENEQTEHRLFAYIEDPKVQHQLEQLVGETLNQEMTYAEATDYLIGHIDKNTGDILTAHPSLTKEFIRFFRDQG